MSDTGQNILAVCRRVEREIWGDWTLESMAAAAGLSPFHFHHLFQELVGEAPVSFVRRLRLEYAAARLKFGDEAAVEVAMAAGYESREGFVRAFHRHFGCPPEVFRERAQRQLDRLARQPAVREASMSVTVIRLSPRTVICRRHTGPYRGIPQTWNRLREWAQRERALDENSVCLGLYHDEPEITPASRLRYDAGLVGPLAQPLEAGMHSMELAGGTYAVADYDGSLWRLERAWEWFTAVWLRESGWHAGIFYVFEEHRAADLLRRTLSWSNVWRRTFRCRLHLPLQRMLDENSLPIKKCQNSNNGHTLLPSFG